MYRLGQFQYLPGQFDQLAILLVFFLHHLPLLIGNDLPLGVRPVRHILIAGISRVMFHIRLRRADNEEIASAPAQMISSAITACQSR